MGDAAPPAARCAAVVLGATALAWGLVAMAWPVASWVVTGRTFEELLVGGCAASVLLAGGWLWLVVLAVALEARRHLPGAPLGEGPPRRGPRGVPPAVRRAVLLACGVALASGATPALAGDQPPPRSASSAVSTAPEAHIATSTAAWVADRLRTAGERTTVVRSGDSLWALAAADLPPAAGTAGVTRHVQRLHDLNRAVIGDDPDLIHPGQRLRLPPAPHEGTPS